MEEFFDASEGSACKPPGMDSGGALEDLLKLSVVGDPEYRQELQPSHDQISQAVRSRV